ncbi:6-pyruvoyl trahydropterin synthase family protein [Flexibacterium corallicola]|uniref:6-pyruvoyl trahydropterin synthase family protein n=1 Tax=Flexibacterium corallicola TaxID=3037259 RepID=UPI00286F1780|nr:6-carboxytetrahydropterin synthase [Pseudovibrio sp. M1P-2-3]
MYSIEVHDHMMIAHSFKGELFGPAQALHGATLEIYVTVIAKELDQYGVVADFDRAKTVLHNIIAPLNYKNLDDLPQFSGKNTTTEFLCGYIFQSINGAINLHQLGRPPEELSRLRVTIEESRNAKASFEAPINFSTPNAK